MAVFKYVAINSSGKEKKGVIDAENARAAKLKLQKEGLFPRSLKEGGENDGNSGWNINIDLTKKKVDTTELAVMTRQLATLVQAGMPLVDSLLALSDQLENPFTKGVISEVCDEVREGSSLADAMLKHSNVFPKIYVNMVSSGESSGKLDIVLTRLADLYESQAALRRKVVSALTYPSLMLVICILAIVLLLAFVVPEITAIFVEKGKTLPLPTRIVVGLSSLILNYWWLLIALAVLPVLWLQYYKKTPEGREKLDHLKLNIPFVGNLTTKIATSLFARNLGTMLASGVELLSALGIARNIVGNVIIEKAVDSAIDGVREGKSLSSELKRTGVFPTILIHMLGIGEKTGDLEPMLLRAADNYDSEVDSVLGRLTTILEPIMILFIAIVVGGILLAIMLPMLEMSNLMSG